jgi:hypothetical protein
MLELSRKVRQTYGEAYKQGTWSIESIPDAFLSTAEMTAN